MSRLAVVLAGFALVAPVMGADGPWVGFQTGSWVKTRTRTVTTAGSKRVETVTEATATLTELTRVEAVVQTEAILTDMTSGTPRPQPAVRSQQRFRFRSTGTPAATVPVKPETGEETLSVGGKRIPCTWSRFSISAAGATTVTKTWSSPAVPGYVAKVESRTTGPATLELSTTVVEFEAK